MSRTEKLTIFNILFMAVVLIFDIIYAMPFTNNPYIFKTIPSALFVVGGTINLFFAHKEGFADDKFKKFSLFIFVGLIFAMMGDILLIDQFQIVHHNQLVGRNDLFLLLRQLLGASTYPYYLV